jgi:N-acetyl-alpha-D-glucosaminyl L-malate synthase BshA
LHLFARRPPFGLESPPPGLQLRTLEFGGAPAADRLDSDWLPHDREALVEAILSVAASVGLDILHFHYGVPFARVAAEVRRRLGATGPALVGTLHGTDVSVHGADPRGAAVLAQSLARLDALTTVSHDHARLVQGTFGLSPHAVIPNFVDIARFHPRPRPARPRRPRIAHVSNFRAVKDPETAARAFALVRRELDAELWLVGDGEGMPRVREILSRAGLERDVRFLGLRADVETLLPRCDVLLVTSRAESFCLAALEAMASGVPVVAPRVGGLPEVVSDGETGLLYEAGDAALAARALVRLLSDTRRAAVMRTAALRTAHLLSSDSIAPRYEALYHALAPGEQGRTPDAPEALPETAEAIG